MAMAHHGTHSASPQTMLEFNNILSIFMGL